MKNRYFIQGVLGRRIFIRSLAIMLVVTLTAMTAQFLINFKNSESLRESSLENYINVVDPSFVRAVWQINDDALNVLLSSLVTRDEVSFATFKSEFVDLAVNSDTNKKVNKQECDKVISKDYSDLVIQGNRLGSGLLEVCYQSEILTAEYLVSTLSSLLPQFLAIFIASLGIVLMINSTVIQPISHLTGYLSSKKPLNDFKSQRPSSDNDDEIELLVRELKDRTQQLLEESSIAQVAFLEVADAIAVTDSDFNIVRSNAALEKLFTDVALNDMVGHNLDEFIEHEYLEITAEVVDFDTSDGKTIEMIGTALKDKESYLGYVFVLRDLTDRRRMQAETLQAQKLGALGTLSGGVAHDFNNLLAVILGNLQLILDTQNLDKESHGMLQEAKYAGERGAELVDKLLTFARKQRFKKTHIAPVEIVDYVETLASRVVSHAIEFETNVQTTGFIEVDRSYLETALLNLVINSRDAMSNGGKIILSAYDEIREGKKFIAFTVEDEGSGIPKEIMGQIYNPFFTTKLQEGTGLGLPMVVGFAQQSGGELSITSENGRGARATIYLPAVESDGDKATANVGLVDGHNEDDDSLSLLVVDDQAAVAKVIKQMLESYGHKVTTANSLLEVKQLSIQISEFDSVICDVVMPTYTGKDVCEYVYEVAPEIPFIFMSGNIPIELQKEIEKLQPFAILSKPFSAADLLPLLRRIK